MPYESYKISLSSSTSIQNRMLNQKERQIRFLYDQAMDREEDTLLNGTPFIESPRIFDRKFVDTVHHKITVETIFNKDRIECGDYLEYEGMMWLCLNSYSFHKLYCRATFMSCDWKIYWINENGELKSEYVIDQNSTQYNSGETGNSTMTLGSAQHMLKMQCNDDTILLDSPMRFAIDKNIKKPTCYKVTQNDNSAYNYGKGLCCITVMETTLNTEADKLVTLDDGSQVWICNYNNLLSSLPQQPQEPDEMTDLSAVISGDSELQIGFANTYSVFFKDKETGNSIDYAHVDFTWKIISDFEVYKNMKENEIELLVEDENLTDEKFKLQVIIDNIVVSEKIIYISGII